MGKGSANYWGLLVGETTIWGFPVRTAILLDFITGKRGDEVLAADEAHMPRGWLSKLLSLFGYPKY